MKFKQPLALLCALCMLLSLVPSGALASDRMSELGAWEGYEQPEHYRRMSYDNLFYSELHGKLLVVLYDAGTGEQILSELHKQGGRWQNTRNSIFSGPNGEIGTLTLMNSEEPEMPELLHNVHDGNGRGYWESFWFEQEDGDYRFTEGRLCLPVPGDPTMETGVMLKQTAEGIASRPYTYLVDGPDGRQFARDAQLVSGQIRISLWDGVGAYPREDFLPMLAEHGILYGQPADMPEGIASLLNTAPHAGWLLTGYARPAGGDTAFAVLRQNGQNKLLCFRLQQRWALAYENEAALPQGDIVMSLKDHSGLARFEAGAGQPPLYGTALGILGDDGNGEYTVRSSTWERDAAGRFLLDFYAHAGQSGMMSFSAGSRLYLETQGGDLRVEDATQRDLAYFSFEHLPDPFLPGGAGARAIAVVSNPRPEDRLNLREAPRRDAPMIGRYYSGTPASILEDDGGDWVKVWIGWDRMGYVLQEFLAFGRDAEQVQSAMPVFTMDGAWTLYYEPFPASHEKARYAGGETIQVMGVMNGWWHVRLQDEPQTIGFIPQLRPL